MLISARSRQNRISKIAAFRRNNSQSGALLVEMAVVFAPFLLLSILVTLETGRAMSHIVHVNQMGYQSGLLASQIQDGSVIEIQNRLNQLAPIYKLKDWNNVTLSGNPTDPNHVVWNLDPMVRQINLEYSVPIRFFFFPITLHFAVVMPHIRFVETTTINYSNFDNPTVLYSCAGGRGNFEVGKDCCTLSNYCP